MVCCLHETDEIHGVLPLVPRNEHRLPDPDSQLLRDRTDAGSSAHTDESVYFG